MFASVRQRFRMQCRVRPLAVIRNVDFGIPAAACFCLVKNELLLGDRSIVQACSRIRSLLEKKLGQSLNQLLDFLSLSDSLPSIKCYLIVVRIHLALIWVVLEFLVLTLCKWKAMTHFSGGNQQCYPLSSLSQIFQMAAMCLQRSRSWQRRVLGSTGSHPVDEEAQCRHGHHSDSTEAEGKRKRAPASCIENSILLTDQIRKIWQQHCPRWDFFPWV